MDTLLHKSRIKLPSGLLRRWLLNSLGVSLLVTLSGLAAFAFSISNYYYNSLAASLETSAATYANFISKNYLTSYDNYYKSITTLAYDFGDRDQYELQFLTAEGRLLISTNSLSSVDFLFTQSGLLIETPDVKTAQGGATSRWMGLNPETGERLMAVSSPIILQGGNKQPIGAIRCVTSLARVDRRLTQLTWIAASVSFVFILMIVSINMLFLRGILIPVMEINSVAKRIAEGGYGARIEKSYKDEMGELVENINHMSGEIRAAERMKSDFISSVSHELRTPLTAISGWGETLLSADMSNPAEIRKGLRIMLKETSRLSGMVEELLDFTRIEGGRMTLSLEPVDIASELEEIVYLQMETLKRDGITLSYSHPDETPIVSGDRARLKQVFVNILDNAVKHGGAGKRIDVALTAEKDWVGITIRDYGAGIPESELPHVKYKFYKGSSSVRGNGIGLSVSDEIMRLHAGELNIESVEGEGTTVTLRFPREPEREQKSAVHDGG